MRFGRLLLVTLVLFLSSISVASAGYLSQYDIVLSVEVAPELVQTSGWTGATTFAAQEGAHSTLTGTSGQSVDHYYIWIYVNGQPILAVDPMTTSDFE